MVMDCYGLLHEVPTFSHYLYSSSSFSPSTSLGVSFSLPLLGFLDSVLASDILATTFHDSGILLLSKSNPVSTPFACLFLGVALLTPLGLSLESTAILSSSLVPFASDFFADEALFCFSALLDLFLGLYLHLLLRLQSLQGICCRGAWTGKGLAVTM
jgi:hypothetical protein